MTCVVYNVVYMGTVTIATRHDVCSVQRVQRCVHGYSHNSNKTWNAFKKEKK